MRPGPSGGDNGKRESMRVTEHLYLYLWSHESENNCNSIFIDGKTPVLIDPGHMHRVPSLFERMRRDGVDPGKIHAVICTHGHPDHFEGTLAFRDGKVKIGISALDEKLVEEVGGPMYARQGLRMPDFRVDFYLKEGDLTLGKHDFQVLHTPGHSPGSLCLYWQRYKLLVPGDVVFNGGVGRVDLPGGDQNLLKKSLERLASLPVELLIPGHGPALQGAEQVRRNFDSVINVL